MAMRRIGGFGDYWTNTTFNNSVTLSAPVSVSCWFALDDATTNSNDLVKIYRVASPSQGSCKVDFQGFAGNYPRNICNYATNKTATAKFPGQFRGLRHVLAVTQELLVQIYVDGVLQAATVQTAQNIPDAYGLQIGGTGGRPLMISDVAVWNSVLTLEDAVALARGRSPLDVNTDFLIEYFPLGTDGQCHDNGVVAGTVLTKTGTPTWSMLNKPNEPIRRMRQKVVSVTVGVLAGTAALSMSSSASAVGQGVVAGSATVSLTATGSVAGIGVLDGAATVTFAGSATLEAVGVISASSSITLAAAAAIEAVGVVTGASSAVFAATGSVSSPVEISGSGAILISSTAAITGLGVVEGASLVSLSATGDIAGVAEIEGVAEITLSASGDTIGVGVMAGNSAITFTASADVVGVAEMSGTSQIGFAASGGIVGVGVITGSSTITFSASLYVGILPQTRCVTVSMAAAYSTTVVAYSRNATVTAAAIYTAAGEIDQC